MVKGFRGGPPEQHTHTHTKHGLPKQCSRLGGGREEEGLEPGHGRSLDQERQFVSQPASESALLT